MNAQEELINNYGKWICSFTLYAIEGNPEPNYKFRFVFKKELMN